MSTNLEYMLEEFYKKHSIPKELYSSVFLFERWKMMREELEEFNVAVLNDEREKVLDAIVDIVYFAIGTAVLLDWNFNEAFKRVHEANMKKVRAYTERSAVDLVKPPGWKAPKLDDLV